MYADVMKVMDGARTIQEHITNLQAILDLPPVEPNLEAGLRAVISSLMQEQSTAIQRW